MLRVHLGPIDQAVGLVQGVDRLGADPVPLQPHHVDAAHLGRVAVHQHVAGDVVDDPRLAADEAVAADRRVMVDGDAAADAGVRLDVDVAAEHRAVGDRDPVAQLAVVGHVRGGHQEVMAAEPGDPVFFLGRPVDRHPFADHVVVADLDPGGGAVVRDVLRLAADDG